MMLLSIAQNEMTFVTFLFMLSLGLLSNTAFAELPIYIDKFKWGGVELISNKNKIEKKLLLNDVPIRENDKVTEHNFYSVLRWFDQKKIQKKIPISSSCNLIESNSNTLFLVIDLSENSFSSHSDDDYRKNNVLSSVFLNSELIRLRYGFEDKLLLMNDRNSYLAKTAEKKEEYYLEYFDSQLSSISKELVQQVSTQKNHIYEVLIKSKDLEEREHAARLLNWVGLSSNDLVFLIDYFPDTSDYISYRLMNIFNDFYFLIPNEKKEKLFLTSNKYLQIDNLNLCIQELLLMSKLIKDNPCLKAKLSLEDVKLIKNFAQNSIIPEIYVSAKFINQLL